MATTVLIARRVTYLVHCIRGLTVAIEGVTGSWSCTAGGSISGATIPRARYTNVLVHSVRGKIVAINGT